MRALYSIIFLLSFVFSGLAQSRPDWISLLVRESKYPDTEYYTGFVSLAYQKDDDVNHLADQLKSTARVNLAESIYIAILSESQSKLSNINGVSDDRYTKSTMTSTSLEATGLKTEVFMDEKERVGYGFSHVNRRALVGFYFRQLSNELSRIKSSLTKIPDLQDEALVYRGFMKEQSALQKARAYQDILKNLEVSNEQALLVNTWNQLDALISDEISKFRGKENVDLEEATHFLADNLLEEIGSADQQLTISAVTFKGSGIVTEFSEYYTQVLYNVLGHKFGKIKRGNAQSGWVLSGTYWPGEENMQITVNINEVISGEVMAFKAGSSFTINYDKIAELKIPYDLPKQQLVATNNQLIRPVANKGGLVVELSTQKGKEGVSFKSGEELKLFAYASRPCYIRIINVWSDDQKFLLADNFYIGAEDVNKTIQLPYAWETACPCGVEFLQMAASDQPFPTLPTFDDDGFTKIKGDLSTILSSTRGFKNIGQQYAESSLIVTTLP